MKVFQIGLAVTLMVGAMAFAGDAAALKKDDKIIMLGDSITQGGGGPKGYITVVQNTLNEKHKDLGIKVINKGISGNKVGNLQARLQKDVLDLKPNLVFIYIGINDVWHWDMGKGKGTTKEDFEAGLKDIIGKIKGVGARVILCTPSVIGEKTDGTNKQDKMLAEYADISRKVAKDEGLTLCDLSKAFWDYLKEHNKENKEKGVLTGDRVHLNEAGNKLVAETMLKALE
ncbi:MAG: SGNH/GDSL hydrolase family protein [Planctomycetota bacterium]